MRLLIEATNTAIGVHRGLLVEPRGRSDLVVRVAGELRPGLINAHDHLHRNHYGRLAVPPYVDAYEWGRDVHSRFATEVERGRAVPRREALLRGAWKNLLSGVTTVVHHDRREPEFDRDFPLRVPRLRCAHSLRFEPGPLEALAGTGPFAIHLAEGVDAAAADEVRELDRRGLLTRGLLAVHVVGADADGLRRLRETGAAVVWCPTSNLRLFGRTALAELLAPGIDVLLGSDSLLTGDGSLLDELRAARSIGHLSDERLLDAVGATAARRLGLAEPSLAPGARADLAVFRRPVLESTPEDVLLVVAGGVVRVAHPALLPALGPLAESGEVRGVGGVERWVGGKAEERIRIPRPAERLRKDRW